MNGPNLNALFGKLGMDNGEVFYSDTDDSCTRRPSCILKLNHAGHCMALLDISTIKLGTNISRLSTTIDVTSQAFKDLENSIREDGLLEPLIVNQDGKLIAGRRRYLAMTRLGIKSCVCVIKETRSTLDDNMVNLIENVIRENPTPADLSIAYTALLQDLKDKGMTHNAALAYLSYKTARSKKDVVTLVRIRERLIPELFRAFEGRGGIALTVGQAAEYAGQSAEEQHARWVEWSATGGRREPLEAKTGEGPEVPARRPRKEIESAIAVLAKAHNEARDNTDRLRMSWAMGALRWVIRQSDVIGIAGV